MSQKLNIKRKKSSATNIDKILVIWIDNIIDKPITKFTEKVKDTNIFSFGISFVKRLNLSEIKYHKKSQNKKKQKMLNQKPKKRNQ